ncbi:guanine nucleotide-binding protein G(q) subunit alpha-like [Garra rufa]|uniref:guanine nucleotide-binding protein G(q) subunit alpha-like n=1 Tax=Garra rufa TaxID=137080 RepID=UPI003CCE7108
MGDYYYCGCCICCLSKKKRNAIAKNEEINQLLLEQMRRERREIKLVLLGTAESGKTTFLKQMRIHHGNGYSEEERRSYTKQIFLNIFQSMIAMTNAMNTLKIPYSNSQNNIYAQCFQDLDIQQITQLQRTYIEAIHHLWADQGFKMCYNRRSEYHLLDSTEYFISNLARIAAEDYMPTNQDILRVKSPTNGFTEQRITYENITLRIVDVSGQRGAIKKWIHCFDSVKSIIFVASLIDYDQVLEENNDQKNRMEESLSLFYTTINSQWFANSSIILLLNKMDILAEKICFSDLKTTFPQFEGRRRDAHDAMEFIRNLYEQKADNFKLIYCHFTCAMDTKITQIIFSDVKDTILINALKDYEQF